MIVIVNLNLPPEETGGCSRIASGLLAAGGERFGPAEVVHHSLMRQAPAEWRGVRGVVLGPQGTPFAAYDAGFLPWLRGLVLDCPVPILGVCGGMQALALAFGGSLGAAYGQQVVGTSYGALRKVQGPLQVQLDPAALPGWLPPEVRSLLTQWPQTGWPAWESHVEQVADLPDDFTCIAHSAPTPIEAMIHRDRPIMASQFHPELGWAGRLPSPLPEVLHGQELAECSGGLVWLRAWLALL